MVALRRNLKPGSVLVFSAQYKMDVVDEYQQNHRSRRRSKRFDETSETTTNFTSQNFLFRQHYQANKPDVESLTEAAHCAKALNYIFPLAGRY